MSVSLRIRAPNYRVQKKRGLLCPKKRSPWRPVKSGSGSSVKHFAHQTVIHPRVCLNPLPASFLGQVNTPRAGSQSSPCARVLRGLPLSGCRSHRRDHGWQGGGGHLFRALWAPTHELVGADTGGWFCWDVGSIFREFCKSTGFKDPFLFGWPGAKVCQQLNANLSFGAQKLECSHCQQPEVIQALLVGHNLPKHPK